MTTELTIDEIKNELNELNADYSDYTDDTQFTDYDDTRDYDAENDAYIAAHAALYDGLPKDTEIHVGDFGYDTARIVAGDPLAIAAALNLNEEDTALVAEGDTAPINNELTRRFRGFLL